VAGLETDAGSIPTASTTSHSGSGSYIPACAFSYPLEQLDGEVQKLADKLTTIPLIQLVSMKLIVNQAYDNMGLKSTQTLGPILDGIMRNTPEGREFVQVAASGGVREAITRRDGPFGDYSPRAGGGTAAEAERARALSPPSPRLGSKPAWIAIRARGGE
jgi:hypothetical protein